MKISELIKKLQANLDVYGDMPVILSKDSEGNRFYSYFSIEAGWSFEEDGEINVCHRNDVDVYKEEGFEVGQALVLWP